ncbi:MAG TPA: ABC transporter permease [Anaerolineae bacterium]|nr:ABC transporter permease [Anaerolineae bacterium]
MEATLATIIAAAAPLLFVTAGETISEKSGVINLSLEGSLMLSALAAFAVAFETGNTWLGFGAGAIVGTTFALVVAFSSITLWLNQVAVGFALASLGIALRSFLGSAYTGKPGGAIAVPSYSIPVLSEIPLLGPALFRHDIVVYSSLLLVGLVWALLYRTRPGLTLQGIGERPEAAHARGVAVNRLRYAYTMLGGALVGIGGAAFTLDAKLGWSFMHTRNFGWIALAIVIFGGWHPVRVAAGVLLFGVLQWLALDLQALFPNLTQVLPIMPFVLMIFALVLVNSYRLRTWADRHPRWGGIILGDAPSAIGRHFRAE